MLNENSLLNIIKENYSSINDFYCLVPAKLGTGENFLLKKENKTTYFVKLFTQNSIYENVFDEIEAHKILIKIKFPTPRYLLNNQNQYLTKIDSSMYIIIQDWVTGLTPKDFSLTFEQTKKAINLLAQINILLKDCNFKPRFLDLTKNLSKRKEETKVFLDLYFKNNRKNEEIVNILKDKIKYLDILEKQTLDMDKFTYVNSHGDYNHLQLLLSNEGEIKYVVDFSRVAKVPAIWEIIRFYSYADPNCQNYLFDKEYFSKLIEEYEKYIKLSEYDKKNIYIMYAMQILSSHFGYKQYIEKGIEDNVSFAIWRVKFAGTMLKICGLL